MAGAALLVVAGVLSVPVLQELTWERPPTGQPPPATIGQPQGPEIVTEIGPQGGKLSADASHPKLPRVELTVPQGALSASARVTMQSATTGEFRSAPELLGAEPALLVALSNAVTGDANSVTRDSLPLVANVLRTTRFAGPVVRLGPSGTRFASEVRLALPLDLVPGVDIRTARAMLRDDHGVWEALPDLIVDDAAATATVRLRHFSDLWLFVGDYQGWYWKLHSGGVDNGGQGFMRDIADNSPFGVLRGGYSADDPFGIAAQTAIGDELARLDPVQKTFDDFAAAASCAGVRIQRGPNRTIPPYYLMRYLTAQNNQELYGDSDAEASLLKWLEERSKELKKESYFRKASVPQMAWREEHEVPIARVFAKALELMDGDVFMALVVAHNVLRRDRSRDESGGRLNPILQNYRGDAPRLIRNFLDPATKTYVNRLVPADETGARYHLFGTAIYSYAYQSWHTPYRYPYLNSGLLFSPDNLVFLEEGLYPSRDWRDDPMETAVDLQGIELGKMLFTDLRDAPFRPGTCELLELSDAKVVPPVRLVPGRLFEATAGQPVRLTGLVRHGAADYGFRWTIQPEVLISGRPITGAKTVLDAQQGGTTYLTHAAFTPSAAGAYVVNLELRMKGASSNDSPLMVATLRVSVGAPAAPPLAPPPAQQPGAPAQPCPPNQQPGLGGLQDALRCTPMGPAPSPRTTEFDLHPRVASPAPLPFCERNVFSPGSYGPLTSRGMRDVAEGRCNPNEVGRPNYPQPPFDPPRK